MESHKEQSDCNTVKPLHKLCSSRNEKGEGTWQNLNIAGQSKLFKLVGSKGTYPRIHPASSSCIDSHGGLCSICDPTVGHGV